MAVSVRCPHCQQTFQLRDELAGRMVRCKCGRPVQVPGGSGSATLSSLLNEELSRPYDPPPEREPPEKPPTKYQPIPPPGYTPPPEDSASGVHGPKWQTRPKTRGDHDGSQMRRALGWLLIIVIIILVNIMVYYMTTG